MIKVKIPDAVVTSENSKQSEIFMKLNLRTESDHERGHEGERVETDGQYPASIQTPKSGNEDQSAEDNSKAYLSENYDALKAKNEELKKEISILSCLMKKNANSCMRLKIENNNLLKQELKKKCSKDEISKLEAMNPDGNSQSLDDDEHHNQTTSESLHEFNSSPDYYSDDKGETDSLTLLQMEKE